MIFWILRIHMLVFRFVYGILDISPHGKFSANFWRIQWQSEAVILKPWPGLPGHGGTYGWQKPSCFGMALLLDSTGIYQSARWCHCALVLNNNIDVASIDMVDLVWSRLTWNPASHTNWLVIAGFKELYVFAISFFLAVLFLHNLPAFFVYLSGGGVACCWGR